MIAPCDRCGVRIEAEPVILTVGGRLAQEIRHVVLCEPCWRGFLGGLDHYHATREEAARTYRRTKKPDAPTVGEAPGFAGVGS